ncbi:hypothetical protein ACS0TY_003889 [Phlomoides rotata]
MKADLEGGCAWPSTNSINSSSGSSATLLNMPINLVSRLSSIMKSHFLCLIFYLQWKRGGVWGRTCKIKKGWTLSAWRCLRTTVSATIISAPSELFDLICAMTLHLYNQSSTNCDDETDQLITLVLYTHKIKKTERDTSMTKRSHDSSSSKPKIKQKVSVWKTLAEQRLQSLENMIEIKSNNLLGQLCKGHHLTSFNSATRVVILMFELLKQWKEFLLALGITLLN